MPGLNCGELAAQFDVLFGAPCRSARRGWRWVSCSGVYLEVKYSGVFFELPEGFLQGHGRIDLSGHDGAGSGGAGLHLGNRSASTFSSSFETAAECGFGGPCGVLSRRGGVFFSR